MKIALPCYLLGLAVVWCSASWGENPAPTGMYQATIAADGVQHVTMDIDILPHLRALRLRRGIPITG